MDIFVYIWKSVRRILRNWIVKPKVISILILSDIAKETVPINTPSHHVWVPASPYLYQHCMLSNVLFANLIVTYDILSLMSL